MPSELRREGDPLTACVAIAVAFFLANLVRLGAPAAYVFDEGFYVPAASELLSGTAVLNREHPMLGKEILALSLWLFGDHPVAWRIPSLILMPIAVFFAMRAMWEFTRDRPAVLLFGVLLATSCLFNVLGRVGTLDAPMLAFAGIGAYLLGRGLATRAAIAFGLCLACKWSIAPLLPVVALSYALHRDAGWRGMIEELARFGLVPLAVYAATFAPGFFVADHPLKLGELGYLHLAMGQLLAAYDGPSPYTSQWWEWLLNLGPYWGYADRADEAWRFVVLIVNPVSALLILPAAVLAFRDRRALVMLPFFLLPMVLAAASGRVQFVHQYALPLAIGYAMAALLLARYAPRPMLVTLVAAIVGAYLYLYPALTAAGHDTREAGQRYVLFATWDYVDFARWAKRHRQDYATKRGLQQACLEEPGRCLAGQGRFDPRGELNRE